MRSRAAAQILVGSGFKQVYNLKGGLAAWQGAETAGSINTGMMILKGDETPKDIIQLAYGLEEGLRKFYSRSSHKVSEPEVIGIFTKLAEIEVIHKKRLFNLYRNFDTNIRNVETFETMINSEFMEGGFTTEQFYSQNITALHTAASVLDFAMMLEAQAMDLYMRYSAKSEDPQVKDILFKMADEEKAHLKRLADLIEKTANV